MNTLKKPLVLHRPPTDYFKRRKFHEIVAAAKAYEYGGGRDCWFRARRMLALVLLMRWSGLATGESHDLGGSNGLVVIDGRTTFSEPLVNSRNFQQYLESSLWHDPYSRGETVIAAESPACRSI